MTGRRNRFVFTLLALLPMSATILQPGPLANSQTDEPETETLFQIELEAGVLPTPPAFIRLVRITLDPGATSPAHTHPGPEFGLIESGVATIQVDGPAFVKQRSAEPDDPFAEARQGQPFQVDPGDRISYPAGTPLTFRNEGEEPVEILAVVILPAQDGRPPLIEYVGDNPTEEGFNGVTSQILGDAIATTLPSGASRVSIDRVDLGDGQSLPGSRNPVMFSLVSGDLDFTVAGGLVQVTRMKEPGPQVGAERNTEVELSRGDAVFFPQGVRTTGRGDESQELTLLRLLIEPVSGDERLPEDDRGQIRVKPPAEGEADEDPAPTEEGQDGEQSADTFSEGDTVFVNSVDVNLRDAPNLAANQVTVLQFNQELVITGGPTDAEGIRWWPVALAGENSIAGFVAEEFIQSTPAE